MQPRELPEQVRESQVMFAAAYHYLLTGPKPEYLRPRSSQWPAVRRQHLEQHLICAACGGTDCLEVHHIAPFHLYPALELDPANLLTLCERPSRLCHFTWGHFWNWARYNPSVVADVQAWSAKRVAA